MSINLVFVLFTFEIVGSVYLQSGGTFLLHLL